MPRVTPDSVSADLADLAASYDEAMRRRAHPRFGVREASVSGWSAAEHAWHHEALTRLVLSMLARLAAGRGRDEPVAPETERILALGHWRRGALEAPETLRPPGDGAVDLDVLAETQARHAAAVAALDPATIVATEGTYPHPAFGAVDAAGWVRVLARHARHHAAIADDVLAAADAATR